jgi:hypothetical protein
MMTIDFGGRADATGAQYLGPTTAANQHSAAAAVGAGHDGAVPTAGKPAAAAAPGADGACKSATAEHDSLLELLLRWDTSMADLVDEEEDRTLADFLATQDAANTAGGGASQAAVIAEAGGATQGLTDMTAEGASQGIVVAGAGGAKAQETAFSHAVEPCWQHLVQAGSPYRAAGSVLG